MITGELKTKVNRIWDTMWSGGISNPLSVIEQLTYLLFIKRLDELHTLRESKAARTGKPIKFDLNRQQAETEIAGQIGWLWNES
jgi:type I restriction enzyme M protein